MKTGILMMGAALLLPMAADAGGTFATGSKPWSFENRSRENHLTMQMRGPGAAPGSVSAGYPGMPVISNTYAIANWVQVDMVLGDNSTGNITIDSTQTSTGSQTATSVVDGEILELYEEN